MWAEIGSRLRQARESLGLSLDELQDKTQVDKVSLQALETGDFNKISSPFYVRSYIRTYAKAVGLEPTYLLKHYRPIQEGGTGSFPTVGTQTGMPSVQSPPLPQNGGGSGRDSGPYDPYATTRMDMRRMSGSFRTTDDYRQKGVGDPSSSTGPHSVTSTGDYDPYQTYNRSSGRGRTTVPPESPSPGDAPNAANGSPDYGEGDLPSRSRTHSTKLSKLSDTLKLPALTKKADEEPGSSNDSSTSSGGELQLYQPAQSNPPQELSRRRKVITDVETYDGDGTPSRARYRRSASSSRSSKMRGAGKWLIRFPKTRLARFAVAAVIVLVPMTVWAGISLMDDEDTPSTEKTGDRSDSVETASTEEDQGGGYARLISVNRTAELGEYELSEPDAVDIKLKMNDESWVQIRENQKVGSGVLKDITLKPGEDFSYKHPKDQKTDVWITIASPQNATVTINEQEIDSTKTIHIKKQ
ncbi:helix-turn-helix domain-containing protein [Paludifilum halophilum]|uniref:helix-turn-helix domain-containing protein n=1 Tax=Paludifilum halophilum TaxID=1642702 RepID=UPI00146D98E5|nr:helix-turn-helix domain-containing protein [Paludifilum halophilum]